MSNTKGSRNYMRNFQTKKRRRREGKTDYQHRRNLLRQDCTQSGNVKSRLVVRFTNSKVICSIVKAFIDGDRAVAYAESTELKNYGIEFGLTNHFAAYATGFLCARRALASNGLDKIYQPNTNVGEYVITEDKDEENQAYKVFLDIGLARASKGANVFIAMKGASDAGLQIPHSESKFIGFSDKGLDSNVLRNRIFMQPNIDYMMKLRDEDEDRYKKQFSKYISLGIKPEEIQSKLESCLKHIAENPVKGLSEKKKDAPRAHYDIKVRKLTSAERKERAKAKIATAVHE